MSTEKTHYRKAFNSPYLSSADIVEPTVLTIARVVLEPDKTKKTKDHFNTAYFTDKYLRDGEPLKPMILNAGNSRNMKKLADSPFIDDWNNIRVTVYVDHDVKFGRDKVEGLRIGIEPPRTEKPWLTPSNETKWKQARAAFLRDGNLDKVLERVQITPENQAILSQPGLSQSSKFLA